MRIEKCYQSDDRFHLISNEKFSSYENCYKISDIPEIISLLQKMEGKRLAVREEIIEEIRQRTNFDVSLDVVRFLANLIIKNNLKI